MEAMNESFRDYDDAAVDFGNQIGVLAEHLEGAGEMVPYVWECRKREREKGGWGGLEGCWCGQHGGGQLLLH